MEENGPALIWPLENLRSVVRVIDNCVWVECSVSVDNDSQKSNLRVCSSSLERRDIVFPLLSALGWPGVCMPKMPIIAQSSQPICNYVVFADNDLPSASTVELVLFINMPDGDNWWKVIGQWRCNSFHSEMAPVSPLLESPFPECETAVLPIMIH